MGVMPNRSRRAGKRDHPGDLAAGFIRFHCPDCGHEKAPRLLLQGAPLLPRPGASPVDSPEEKCPQSRPPIIPPPPDPPFDIAIFEPIEPPWQAIRD